MRLSLDEDSRQLRRFVCDCCNTPAERTWAFVHRDGAAHAVYFASCYHHGDAHEAWIDVILGTWGTGSVDDHVTFGCRVGAVPGSPAPAASLVRGGDVAPDEPVFGRKLTREEALTHPRPPEFWQVVDLVLTNDHLVHQHVYGPAT
jgi:hypothetical protein